MGLELFSSAGSDSLSITSDKEDFIAELIEDEDEDASYITTKSDTFSLTHEINESPSSEDANFVLRKDEEFDGFYTTAIAMREPLFLEQIMEMHNATDLVEENGEDANEEQPSILQDLTMDEWSFILAPDQWDHFSDPVGAIVEQQFSTPIPEIPEKQSPPSSFGRGLFLEGK